MSFGVVQSAISSIKSNRNLLSKRSRLKNTLSAGKSKKIIFKKSYISDYELKKLSDKLKEEHRRILIKQVMVVSFIMLILLSIFLYYF
ncbi:hypothetical protein DIS18_13360 [Algibacter marinivivus]|uniref:Uncharacterized protein n=1 Tax=Algibacter marinivivus TaxID=2100723 RepID=A0A2U2X1N4_9FLAO|nr:hypothetical protein DIS18_13360 [Algibacter marinivivus]